MAARLRVDVDASTRRGRWVVDVLVGIVATVPVVAESGAAELPDSQGVLVSTPFSTGPPPTRRAA